MDTGCHNNLALTLSEDTDISDRGGLQALKSTEQSHQLTGSIVSFHNICYTVKQKKGYFHKATFRDILQNLNGIMRPGLNAILGPTGSGKSSLLDVLAARKDPAGLTGEVLIDGTPQSPKLKGLYGYVVQDDVVMGSLTVRENLCFSAALRLPSSVPQSEKDNRVNDLIIELGLIKVAESKVGNPLMRGISGGERKRTSIAMEMICNPSVLFLDEPTTGLDASTAICVIKLLKRMANQGKTIIISIHQPRYSIYSLFDTLTLLLGGYIMYHGPQEDALDYFANIGYHCEPHNNPADFFVDIINGEDFTTVNIEGSEKLKTSSQDVQQHLLKEYENSICCRNTLKELGEIQKDFGSNSLSHYITYNSSYLHQLRWVFKRTFKQHFLDPRLTIAELTAKTILALVMGIVFFDSRHSSSGIQNRMGALFFLVSNMCFSTVVVCDSFISEKKLFLHEYLSGYYRTSVYFLAKVLSNLTVYTISAMITTMIMYFMIGFKKNIEAFFTFILTVVMGSHAAIGLTTAVSADKSAPGLTILTLQMTYIFMIVFSGFLVNLSTVLFWLAWLKYLSIPGYALTINEFVGLNFCEKTGTQNANMSLGGGIFNGHALCTGEQHLEYMGVDYTTWGLWKNHVALFSMALIFFIIGYLKLRLMKKFT